MQVEKVLEAMEITSDVTKIRLAAFQLEGEAQVWWKWARTSIDLEAMTWAEFQELFMGKYFPYTARHAKAQEFLELKQGTMTVMDYVARFPELARFADDYMATDMTKVRRFLEWTEVVHSGQDCRTSPTGYGLHGWDNPDHRERDRGCSEHSGCGC